MQTRKQNDCVNSGRRTINSPCPWELLSSRLFRAGVSSRDVTLRWRALPVFVLLVWEQQFCREVGARHARSLLSRRAAAAPKR